MHFNTAAWSRWIGTSLRTVDADARVRVPFDLPHPSASGFIKPAIAEPAGQVADYVMPLPDGTRVHVHDMDTEGLLAHRELDPGQGLIAAAVHVATETKFGRLCLVVGGLSLVFGAAPTKNRAIKKQSTPKKKRRRSA